MRLELLSPFPSGYLHQQLEKYPHARGVCVCVCVCVCVPVSIWPVLLQILGLAFYAQFVVLPRVHIFLW